MLSKPAQAWLVGILVAGLVSSLPAQELAALYTVHNKFQAAEATQAVAVDHDHFYAIASSQIGKYRRSDGQRVALKNQQMTAQSSQSRLCQPSEFETKQAIQ